MFSYIKKIYKQLKTIYSINKIIDKINENSHLGIESKIQQVNLQELKTYIFSSGSVYIKFFQWYVSKLKANIVDNKSDSHNRSDNTSLQIITYFEDIFEQCPYHDLKYTQAIFKSMMPSLKLEEYIDISTLKEIASGSIGQIYYARRLSDNKEIAIKVKHPDVDIELENQTDFIKFIKYIQSINYFRKRYNLFINIDDFMEDINLQCNFNNEAENIKLFRENFKDSAKYIIFPKVLYQSRDMLISEFVDASPVDTVNEIQKFNASLIFICFFYQMLIVDNHIHGDLHCKNWKVRVIPDTVNDIQLVIYDCGICFKNINVELTRDFWFSIGKYDVEMVSKTFKKFIIKSNYNIDDESVELEIKSLLKNLGENNLSTSIIVKSIINFFSSKDIIVHKFLLNFSILMCLIEEFLKKNELINRDKSATKSFNMYDVINESQLDVIAFTETKNCFLSILDIFKNEQHNKYKIFNTNISKNNVQLEGTKRILFNSISLSNLKLNIPE
jgi:predicted unusual protein kinase regulating ubiquinone biosynthesis (AarF/ABC1/UbiB family)